MAGSSNDRRVDAYQRHRTSTVFGSAGAAGEAAPPSQALSARRPRPRRSFPVARGSRAAVKSVDVFIITLSPVSSFIFFLCFGFQFSQYYTANHLPDYAPTDLTLRLNHRKYDVFIERLRRHGLVFTLEISTADAPSTFYNKVATTFNTLCDTISLRFPPALGANTFRRTPWILLNPGNEPRNGSSMRVYKPCIGSELPDWWNFPNVRRTGTRGWAPPPRSDGTTADFNLVIGEHRNYYLYLFTDLSSLSSSVWYSYSAWTSLYQSTYNVQHGGRAR